MIETLRHLSWWHLAFPLMAVGGVYAVWGHARAGKVSPRRRGLTHRFDGGLSGLQNRAGAGGHWGRVGLASAGAPRAGACHWSGRGLRNVAHSLCAPTRGRPGVRSAARWGSHAPRACAVCTHGVGRRRVYPMAPLAVYYLDSDPDFSSRFHQWLAPGSHPAHHPG